MTRDEFNEWLEYHLAIFPGAEKWLDCQSVSREDILYSWERRLRSLELVDAIAASDEMGDNAEEFARYTRIYEIHPAVVRRQGQKRYHDRQETRPTWYDGEQTVSCPHCRDSKFVSVWQWKSTYKRWCIVSIPCCCPRASAITWTSRRFDPNKMHNVDIDSEDFDVPPKALLEIRS